MRTTANESIKRADAPPRLTPASTIAGVAIVSAAVFFASLFGIMTRPVGSLAAFWPANALLLGLVVSNPRLATLPGWCGAFAAYVAADLLTGGSLSVTLWLTAANMIGALTGVLLFRKLNEADRTLTRPLSVLYLLLICVVASLAAAVSGGGAARIIFGRSFLPGVEFWFVTELVNNLIILPVILTWPSSVSDDGRAWRPSIHPPLLMPAGALIVSGAVAVAVGGPGAIVFSVPALIWCALTYSTFPTSVLTAVYCAGMLMAASAGLIFLPMSSDMVSSISSLRLGIALTAIGPLTVSSINTARENLLACMRYAADHDALTQILSRRGLLNRGQAAISRAIEARAPVALLMLDIDYFKTVNDSHGHVAGDAVLVEFARRVGAVLDDDCIFGRLGGEEFAVIVPGADERTAFFMAERIRNAVASEAIRTGEGLSIEISTSIGVATAKAGVATALDRLLVRADSALYGAKSQGRNRVLAAA